ncbi:FAD/NAD(P)-binding domain-containing protein [Karstenula rhodostoma CBS 690.94]|uniref:FAD/NAD(P)-binding domain-containing protein n=1 Tax=Karstenula rhodostoma CBS 690.94 TaxID=1392251 RepID=A0A9P4PYF4_9PLEO|nr:FAD/NAD(P)-binding domain-containing protein [Karstenula rhodostoma CBS 690.94]
MSSLPTPERYDVVVVGGGFGGVYSLHHMRELGFATHMYEAGSGLGGIWHWNCYPGARVDVETPVYQLYAPELYKEWKWEERYSGRNEMVEYFNHIADKWDLRGEITLKTRVAHASWDQDNSRFRGVMCHTALWSKDIELKELPIWLFPWASASETRIVTNSRSKNRPNK